eukprot:801881-Pleurochrysis_carterae.AAC.1
MAAAGTRCASISKYGCALALQVVSATLRGKSAGIQIQLSERTAVELEDIASKIFQIDHLLESL